MFVINKLNVHSISSNSVWTMSGGSGNDDSVRLIFIGCTPREERHPSAKKLAVYSLMGTHVYFYEKMAAVL